MKTAISIPDELFEAADMAAKRLGISRSQLYARAVADYLTHHGSRGVTEQLDQVYQGQPSGLDAVLEQMQFASIDEEDW